MKKKESSRIVLQPADTKLAEELAEQLGVSKKEVVLRAIRLLHKEYEKLQKAYEDASLRVRKNLKKELAELDHLSGEGIDDEEE